MKRIHLFEFEDLRWFPSFIRNYMTDFLQFLSNKTNMFESAVPIIERGIANSHHNRIVDLASGGGGGLQRINGALLLKNPELTIVLTDYYPHIAAFQYAKKQAENFFYIEKPVDARNVPSELKGLRTQFLSFHHFKPVDARQILQNAVDANSPIAVFEAQERSFLSFFAMLLSPLTVLLTTPFIRPFRWGRIVFTYIIPIIPLVVLWDGIVSSLRTYSVPEMHGLVDKLNKRDCFEWEIGRRRSMPGCVLYLLGYPKKA